MRNILLLVLFVFISEFLFSQSSFNLDDYQNFLQNNDNMSAEELLELHDAGKFKSSITSKWNNALFSDSIEIKYVLSYHHLRQAIIFYSELRIMGIT